MPEGIGEEERMISDELEPSPVSSDQVRILLKRYESSVKAALAAQELLKNTSPVEEVGKARLFWQMHEKSEELGVALIVLGQTEQIKNIDFRLAQPVNSTPTT